MPRSEGNIQKAARELHKRLNIDHIVNNTDVFKHLQIGEKALDKHTCEVVQKTFTRWFNSWVKEDLDTVLKACNKKLYEKTSEGNY